MWKRNQSQRQFCPAISSSKKQRIKFTTKKISSKNQLWIKAIADGKVIAVGAANGYGYWVVIDHGIINDVQVTSEYGHISSWNVKYGQIIKQGDIIAKSGNAGYSSGPHLHITIREGHFQGTAVDPSKYLRTNF